ncbi:MAG: nucleotidyltransferase domain-containing protein [Bdellovibrionota bacterium]
MKYGINEKELEIVNSILSKYEEDYSFYFYGSRIKGNFQATSDLDILIKGGSEMPLNVLNNLKNGFDVSPLSFIPNFCDYHKISKEFYELIKADLISNRELIV